MTREEYEAKYRANEYITGKGIGNVWIHMPCPFCAAADFCVYEVLSVEVELAKEHVCKECGRGSKVVTETVKSVPGASKARTMRFVQTRGDDPPGFLSWIEREK